MSKFEVVRGMYGGYCLALDDTRIAGPKPWGGGTVIHAWETNETYKAIDGHSRWHELFGTPERAARTLHHNGTLVCRECLIREECAKTSEDSDCMIMRYDALLEWLRGDAE